MRIISQHHTHGVFRKKKNKNSYRELTDRLTRRTGRSSGATQKKRQPHHPLKRMNTPAAVAARSKMHADRTMMTYAHHGKEERWWRPPLHCGGKSINKLVMSTLQKRSYKRNNSGGGGDEVARDVDACVASDGERNDSSSLYLGERTMSAGDNAAQDSMQYRRCPERRTSRLVNP